MWCIYSSHFRNWLWVGELVTNTTSGAQHDLRREYIVLLWVFICLFDQRVSNLELMSLLHWSSLWRQKCEWRRWASSHHCNSGRRQSSLPHEQTIYHLDPHSSEVHQSLPVIRKWTQHDDDVHYRKIHLWCPHAHCMQIQCLLLHISWCSWWWSPTNRCDCTHCAPPQAAGPAGAYQALGHGLKQRTDVLHYREILHVFEQNEHL